MVCEGNVRNYFIFIKRLNSLVRMEQLIYLIQNVGKKDLLSQLTKTVELQTSNGLISLMEHLCREIKILKDLIY